MGGVTMAVGGDGVVRGVLLLLGWWGGVAGAEG